MQTRAGMDAMKAIAEQLADSPLRQAAQPQHEEQPQQLQRQPEAAAATGAAVAALAPATAEGAALGLAFACFFLGPIIYLL